MRNFTILIVFAVKICKQCLQLLHLLVKTPTGALPRTPPGDFSTPDPWAIAPPMKFRAATGKRWRKVEGIGHAKKIGESEVGDV